MAKRRSRSSYRPVEGGIAHRAIQNISPPYITTRSRRRHYEKLLYSPVEFERRQNVKKALRFMTAAVPLTHRLRVNPGIRRFSPVELPFVSRAVREFQRLTCRQKSQRPTRRPRFSSGGGSRRQWAIARLQRERRCK